MKKISKDDKTLINYIRISLITGVLSAISISLIIFLQINISVTVGIIIFGLLIISVPGFLILPGLIYEDFKTGMTFTIDQIAYYAFVLITLGIGPALVYFIKVEPTISTMLNKEKALNNKL
ncbi:MAG: hypothetical protein GY705_25000 [Bacteroidetes bacterium]|nr:hypothetical protein [Bacteroidota bacterium]